MTKKLEPDDGRIDDDAPFEPFGDEAPRGNGHGPPLPAAIDLVTLADVEPRPVAWLWPGRIARRKLTLLAGEPDLGKSQIALDAAARITRRGLWPDEGSDNAPLGSCIILSAEDAVDDVLRPRLEAAGADLNRMYAVRSVLMHDEEGNPHPSVFSLQRDLNQLGEKIAHIGDVNLIIIDPITAYFGDQVDTHKTAAVRAVLAQVDSFAERYDVAVLGISHPPKAVAGAKAINAITGSLAFVAAARMAFLVVADAADNDRRLILGIKNNLGAKAPGLAYRISTKIVSGNIVTPYLIWDSTPINITANEALAAANETAKERGDAMREAKQFLAIFSKTGRCRPMRAPRRLRRKGSKRGRSTGPARCSASGLRRTGFRAAGRGSCRITTMSSWQPLNKGCHVTVNGSLWLLVQFLSPSLQRLPKGLAELTPKAATSPKAAKFYR